MPAPEESQQEEAMWPTCNIGESLKIQTRLPDLPPQSVEPDSPLPAQSSSRGSSFTTLYLVPRHLLLRHLMSHSSPHGVCLRHLLAENPYVVVWRYTSPGLSTTDGNCGLLGESGKCWASRHRPDRC